MSAARDSPQAGRALGASLLRSSSACRLRFYFSQSFIRASIFGEKGTTPVAVTR